MGRSIPPPKPPIGRVRRSIPPPPRNEMPPPRDELPTLPSCDACGGDKSAERFKYESDPAMRAVREDPIAGAPKGAGEYSNIERCRWCEGTGVMTAPQRERYKRYKAALTKRRKKES